MDDKELVEVLEAGANSIAIDGTPSQVGPAAEELQFAASRITVLREALGVFARCPTQGKDGGRFVIAHAVFDDMKDGVSAPREAYWHADDFERARQALSGEATE